MFGAAMTALAAAGASAQAPAGAPAQAPFGASVQTAAEALDDDAADYSRRHAVPLEEAKRRLRAQEESVAATDLLSRTYRSRLAGIAIEHGPTYRIVVLLTGKKRVRSRFVRAGGMDVPVVFKTRARATREGVAWAVVRHRKAIRSALPGVQGMGGDPRTGELVLMVRGEGVDPDGSTAAYLEELTGVPVRIRALDAQDADSSVEGGARVVGEGEGGRRQFCTTGFVVTDGSRSGVVTAAHCPDSVIYRDPDGEEVPLTLAGSWGAQFQDVQVNVGEASYRPLFYADTGKRRLRSLTGVRGRSSVRAGDTVCHRGETTGYSCAEVELLDYAPAGDLCGGLCDPTWVTVSGPSCKGGDSGGPVFRGTTAFGIMKGGTYRSDGACSFYFFMSTDYLPDGWTLLREPEAPQAALGAGG